MADVLSHTILKSPIGPLAAVASRRGLCTLEFHRDDRLSLQTVWLRRWYPEATLAEGANPHLEKTRRWLARYFSGQFDALETVDLDARGTPFELAVWRAMREVKIGAVSTYSALAARLGKPRASRAVGTASGRNPICIITPCHRIIGADGSLVGYGGGLTVKRWLLQHEAGARQGDLPDLRVPLDRAR